MTRTASYCAVGVDSGTQGTKVVVVDVDRPGVLGRGYFPHAVQTGLKPGESEQDPETWFEAFEAALASALKDSRVDPSSVTALGVSAQQHGFVALDAEGVPIRPAKLWNDTSTLAEADWIVQRLGGRRGVIEKLGLNLAVGYTASKILWLKRHEPQNFSRLAHVLLPHDYLNFRLTGKFQMEYGDASGTGLMDIRTREWNREALAAVDSRLSEVLPPLRHSAEPVGLLRDDVGRRLGLSRVLVSSGGGDNMMSAIGTGNVVPGICTVSLGTSGTVFAYSDAPFIDPEGEIAAFCDSTGGWLPLLCTMNVTNASELFKEIHGLSNQGLEDLAARAPAGAGGLVFLPFIDGERVPVLPWASGVYFGLDRRTFNAAHMARALIEGTILNLGYGFGRMRDLGLRPTEIRATGGAARNKLWLQVLADAFRTPVRTLEEGESAALGAALQAVWCRSREENRELSIAALVEDRVRLSETWMGPNPDNSDLYESLQVRFNSLWKSLAPEFRKRRTPEGD
jgi:xylulokinase